MHPLNPSIDSPKTGPETTNELSNQKAEGVGNQTPYKSITMALLLFGTNQSYGQSGSHILDDNRVIEKGTSTEEKSGDWTERES